MLLKVSSFFSKQQNVEINIQKFKLIMLKSCKDFKDASKVFKVAKEEQEFESHRQIHILVEKIQSQG